MFFLIKYQSIVASSKETSFARQFCRVSLTNRTEINFARQFFGVGLFIISVQQNFRDRLAKVLQQISNGLQSQIQNIRFAAGEPYFGAEEAISF
jgi:hypothetical protein